ncbi:hypothetical protein ACIQC7_28090 [Kitasatospora sp. NPDC088556]|uniref:hypothetical protein n=1 Tax=Kitasatospora sp. NPDC088556 TaxID=3364076 RepID=UPI0037F3E491
MPKRKTYRAIVVGILASAGLAVSIGLSAGTPAEGPAHVADTIWGAVPPQPSPTPTVTASAAVLDDTIWG